MTSGTIPYSQSGRMMAVATQLGSETLLLEHLVIDEAINDLFTFRAAVKSQRDDLEAGDLVGSSVDFSLKLKEGGTRWWNGFCTEMHEGPLTTRGTRDYAMTLRPKLWTLTQRSDCRIFRGMTSPQIVETLCQEQQDSPVVRYNTVISGAPTAGPGFTNVYEMLADAVFPLGGCTFAVKHFRMKHDSPGKSSTEDVWFSPELNANLRLAEVTTSADGRTTSRKLEAMAITTQFVPLQ